jgi:hypothetical protein
MKWRVPSKTLWRGEHARFYRRARRNRNRSKNGEIMALEVGKNDDWIDEQSRRI